MTYTSPLKHLTCFILLIWNIQFTTAQAPIISSFSPASGSVGTPVTIIGTNLNSPTTFSIGGVTPIVISNSGTQLVAMVMPGAITGIINISTTGGTANTNTNFTVVASRIPNIQQGSKLVGTGSVGISYQGASISISADGNTAIVGGYRDNSDQGAAWIYTRSGGTWGQQGTKLVGTGNITPANQGTSVAINADGNTAIVCGDLDNVNGAAWVFTRSGGVWSQQGPKLVGTGNIGNPLQGKSVSLSADGNTAIIGGYLDNSSQGAAWIFSRSGGIWNQQGSKLVGTASVGSAYQGSSVSISADGNTALVGGQSDNTGQGAVWIYTRSGNIWTQQGSKLVGTGVVGNASQGASVSLSADGNTAIVGGATDNGGQGAVWIYNRSGSTWSQQGSKLIGTGNIGPAYQGVSVSLSADGNIAFVSGYLDNSNQGAAWLFSRSGGVWTQQGSKLVGAGSIGQALQGVSVSLSADGNTAIVGGYRDDANVGSGAVWAYINASVLPLRLISFTGFTRNNINHLQWTTADETNTKEFEIERSYDDISFSRIATLYAKGGNGIYKYEDAYSYWDNFYYRLKIIDTDGKFTYSDIIKFSNQQKNELAIYPNPAKDKTTLRISNKKLIGTALKIRDAHGRTVKIFTIKHSFEIVDVSLLPAGLYFLQTMNGHTLKLIKK